MKISDKNTRRTRAGILFRRAALPLAVLAALLTTAQPSTAQPAPPEAGAVVVVPAGDEVGAMGANCGGIIPPDPCGIVNNRTSRNLEAARDSKSHTGCDLWPDSSAHPRKVVPPGRNSNQSPEYFKDTDCFRSTECRVFYLGWHNPGEWIRIWGSVYVYDLNC